MKYIAARVNEVNYVLERHGNGVYWKFATAPGQDEALRVAAALNTQEGDK